MVDSDMAAILHYAPHRVNKKTPQKMPSRESPAILILVMTTSAYPPSPSASSPVSGAKLGGSKATTARRIARHREPTEVRESYPQGCRDPWMDSTGAPAAARFPRAHKRRAGGRETAAKTLD